jgi:hypothetical protein
LLVGYQEPQKLLQAGGTQAYRQLEPWGLLADMGYQEPWLEAQGI